MILVSPQPTQNHHDYVSAIIVMLLDFIHSHSLQVVNTKVLSNETDYYKVETRT